MAFCEIFFFNFQFFMPYKYLVLPCTRCVRKETFDVTFTNKTFVTQLIISNRQHTQPVYEYRLYFSYKSLKYIFGGYPQIPLNKTHGVFSQGTAGFTHTPFGNRVDQ